MLLNVSFRYETLSFMDLVVLFVCILFVVLLILFSCHAIVVVACSLFACCIAYVVLLMLYCLCCIAYVPLYCFVKRWRVQMKLQLLVWQQNYPPIDLRAVLFLA